MTTELAQPVDPPRLFVYDGWGDALGYPALVVDHEATGVVPGMLLTADGLDTQWDELDAFEGAAYRRVTIPVTTANGTRRSAQAYVLRPRS